MPTTRQTTTGTTGRTTPPPPTPTPPNSTLPCAYPYGCTELRYSNYRVCYNHAVEWDRLGRNLPLIHASSLGPPAEWPRPGTTAKVKGQVYVFEWTASLRNSYGEAEQSEHFEADQIEAMFAWQANRSKTIYKLDYVLRLTLYLKAGGEVRRINTYSVMFKQNEAPPKTFKAGVPVPKWIRRGFRRAVEARNPTPAPVATQRELALA